MSFAFCGIPYIEEMPSGGLIDLEEMGIDLFDNVGLELALEDEEILDVYLEVI